MPLRGPLVGDAHERTHHAEGGRGWSRSGHRPGILIGTARRVFGRRITTVPRNPAAVSGEFTRSTLACGSDHRFPGGSRDGGHVVPAGPERAIVRCMSTVENATPA